MKRIAGAVAGLALLLAGCGSAAAADTDVIAACQDFSAAWNDQMDVVNSNGPHDDYTDAVARMGEALGRGSTAAAGDLKASFTAAMQGWAAQQVAEEPTLADTTTLIVGYQSLIRSCAALGAKVSDPTQ